MGNSSDPDYTYTENKYYKLYEEEKKKIKEKYPKEVFKFPNSGRRKENVQRDYIELGHREIHKQYLKEIADLIFQPNGNFQELTWDVMSEVHKLEMERKTRPSMQGKYKRD